jgi:hypothetical protein
MGGPLRLNYRLTCNYIYTCNFTGALKKNLSPTHLKEDLVNLGEYHVV